MGFLTNLLNPKAVLFFLSIFSQFISVETGIFIQIIYAMTCVFMCFLWFAFVSLILTNNKVKSAFLNISKHINRICGGILVVLGLKLALTKMQT